MKTITFTLKDDGTIVLESSGYTGVSCAKDTKIFEEALSMKVTDDKKKPEWYQSTAMEQLRAMQ